MGTQIHSTMKFERPTQAQRQLEWGTRAEEVRASLDCLEVHDLRWKQPGNAGEVSRGVIHAALAATRPDEVEGVGSRGLRPGLEKRGRRCATGTSGDFGRAENPPGDVSFAVTTSIRDNAAGRQESEWAGDFAAEAGDRLRKACRRRADSRRD